MGSEGFSDIEFESTNGEATDKGEAEELAPFIRPDGGISG